MGRLNNYESVLLGSEEINPIPLSLPYDTR